MKSTSLNTFHFQMQQKYLYEDLQLYERFGTLKQIMRHLASHSGQLGIARRGSLIFFIFGNPRQICCGRFLNYKTKYHSQSDSFKSNFVGNF